MEKIKWLLLGVSCSLALLFGFVAVGQTTSPTPARYQPIATGSGLYVVDTVIGPTLERGGIDFPIAFFQRNKYAIAYICQYVITYYSVTQAKAKEQEP